MNYIRTHINHCFQALRFSVSGFLIAFKDEIAFRQILALLCISVFLALWLGESWSEIILLILPSAFCVVIELLNTAIENVVDLASPDWRLLAKKAKDTASAAQFFAQIITGLVWISWLIHKFS